ncbi:hypothetical protein WJX72_011305 [[Myrmecia] bisecta]|uniref:Patatin n=1 Tax=[Myrmecia] bisecta TaxID=41462 RepID=A0AAW1PLK5_9CHLO
MYTERVADPIYDLAAKFLSPQGKPVQKVQREQEEEAGEDSTGKPDPVVAAIQAGSLGFGFSAGGLLFPYYLGVLEGLSGLGILTPDTKLGGASAGSLIAVSWHSGLPLSEIQDACFVFADNCRRNGTRGRLGVVLRQFLEDLLPEDIHLRCKDRAYVAVTRAFPVFKGELYSEWSSREDLINSLMTSCHIPWYFNNQLMTEFHGAMHFDGGLTNFIPLPPTQHAIRVCCFPSKQVQTVLDIGISPDTYEAWPYSLAEMLRFALQPADHHVLRAFIAKGKSDAEAWALASGAADAVKAIDRDAVKEDREDRKEEYSELKDGDVSPPKPEVPVGATTGAAPAV